ncbi:hypothetical protein [Arenibaculum pallidiluteum]|uniref:hypothetical protein n=1 Tax=Arenibaculum pallidiluteum TaxID=2812559 RepID=UPI001A960572|nr:hypothetical protein [Arenibaculum pallidiluteum]
MSVHQFRRPTPPRRPLLGPGPAAGLGVVAGGVAAMLLGPVLGGLSILAGMAVAFFVYRGLSGLR